MPSTDCYPLTTDFVEFRKWGKLIMQIYRNDERLTSVSKLNYQIKKTSFEEKQFLRIFQNQIDKNRDTLYFFPRQKRKFPN